jgi:hypothetical protein
MPETIPARAWRILAVEARRVRERQNLSRNAYETAEVCDLRAPIDRYRHDSDSVPIRGFPVCKCHLRRQRIAATMSYQSKPRGEIVSEIGRRLTEGGLPQTDRNLVS